ncbi:MAG: isochorismatase family protein [Desulfoprunum sp.]|nr:isochorismatase family protein [Desulfoprunum sp.]
MGKSSLLKPENCCLHIIDIQKSLMAQIHEAERVVATARLMLEFARVIKIPVLANTQYRKGLGLYVPEMESLMEGIPRPDKVEFNALANAETRSHVAALPATVTTMVLVGVETHICIYQTAAGILDRGLVPWIVEDAVSARSEKNHKLALQRLREMGAIIGPAEMLIYELLGRAGTPLFKEVLPLIINHKP